MHKSNLPAHAAHLHSEIAWALTHARLLKGLTTADVARLARVNVTRVRAYERPDYFHRSVSKLAMIADALGLEIVLKEKTDAR